MAEQDRGNVPAFSDFVDSITSAVRSVAARYIDVSESFAKQMLEFQVQTTGWAKETPMAPIFQSQLSFSQGLIELWAGAWRAMWQIEPPNAES